MHPTINHAKTQKRRDAPYCVQLRGSVGREPRQSYKFAPHLSVSAFLYKRLRMMPHTTTPPHVLSRCVFIPNKFPTLLAEREIIANAFCFTLNVPPPSAPGHRGGVRMQR